MCLLYTYWDYYSLKTHEVNFHSPGTLLEEKYEAKLELPGGRGGAKQKTFCGGSMDNFWNVLHSQMMNVTFLTHERNDMSNQEREEVLLGLRHSS